MNAPKNFRLPYGEPSTTTRSILHQMCEKLWTLPAERMRPEKILIFGSHAKGTATIRSDLDVFVKETSLPMAHRADALRPIRFQKLIHIDIHVYAPEEVEEYGKDEFSFVHSVLKSGKTVFGQ